MDAEGLVAGGLGFGARAFAGLVSGAGTTADVGAGWFSESGLGGYASTGSFAGLPGNAFTSPAGATGSNWPFAAGLYGGYGPSLWFSTANRPSDLAGPGLQMEGAVGLLAASLGISVTLSNSGHWTVAVAPPIPYLSGGVGAGAQALGTNTCAKDLIDIPWL